MKNWIYKFLGTLTIILSALGASCSAMAAPALQFVTLTGAGSLTDTALRQLVPAIERETGAAAVVLNQPGAGGVVGARQVANAARDGSVILMGNSSLGHMQLTGAAQGFDPLTDFVPLQGLVRSEFGVFVPMDSPARSVNDLKTLQARKGDLLVGTASPMSVMSAALLDQRLDTRSTVVGYKQFGQALADLAGARLDYMTGPLSAAAVQGMLEAGKIRQIDTLGRLNVADFSWSGFFVHRDTPLATQRRLADALQRAVNDTPLAGKLAADALVLRRIQQSEVAQMQKALAPH